MWIRVFKIIEYNDIEGHGLIGVREEIDTSQETKWNWSWIQIVAFYQDDIQIRLYNHHCLLLREGFAEYLARPNRSPREVSYSHFKKVAQCRKKRVGGRFAKTENAQSGGVVERSVFVQGLRASRRAKWAMENSQSGVFSEMWLFDQELFYFAPFSLLV